MAEARVTDADPKEPQPPTAPSLSSDALFFPEKVTGCVHHIFKPEYDSEGLISQPSISAPVRIGPLEFRLKVVLDTGIVGDWENPDYDDSDNSFTEQTKDFLVWYLIYDNVSPTFPWSGEVDAAFQVLVRGAGLPSEWTYKKKAIVSSDQKKSRRLRAKKNDWHRRLEWGDDVGEDDENYLSSFLDDEDCLHVRVFLTVKVRLKSGPGVEGGTWRIPRILMDQPTQASQHTTAFPDITLISRDGREFPANRFILAGSSDVFTTMFTWTGMKEGADGRVKIEDIGGKTLGLMLKFLYSGNIREEMEKIEEYELEDFLELLHAGHKYNITVLMKLAGVALLLRCRKENASLLYSALEIYGDGVRETRASLEEFMKKKSELTVNDEDALE